MKNVIKYVVVLGSEFIWTYYILAFLISLKSEGLFFIDPTWWVIAAIVGFIVNFLLIGNVYFGILVSVNVVCLIGIVIQNWKATVPEGTILPGIFLSIAIIFIFGRSIHLLFETPKRLQILYRFEGNMIIYIILLFIFLAKDWDDPYFHASFITVIVLSLLGMILTLQEQDQTPKKNVHIQQVGQSGWFSGIIAILFVIIIAVSSSLLLPSMRGGIQSFTFATVNAFVWLYYKFEALVGWLIQWIPYSESEIPEELLEMGQEDARLDQVEAELLPTLGIEWFLIPLAIIAGAVILFIFAKLLKLWQVKNRPSFKQEKGKQVSWEAHMWRMFIDTIERIRMWIRKRNPRFYKERIYWNVRQIERWGEKNGFSRQHAETIKEYVARIIEKIIRDKKEESLEAREKLIEQLRDLQTDFHAAYYGGIVPLSNAKYNKLPKQLNKYFKELAK